jgi:hypothetical protein
MALLKLDPENPEAVAQQGAVEGNGVLDKLNSWIQSPAADAMIAALLEASGPGGGTMGQAIGRGLLGGNKLMAEAAGQKLQQDEFKFRKENANQQNAFEKERMTMVKSEFGLKEREAARKARQTAREDFYFSNGRPPKDEAEIDAFMSGTASPAPSSISSAQPTSGVSQAMPAPQIQGQSAPIAPSINPQTEISGGGGLLTQTNSLDTGEQTLDKRAQDYYRKTGDKEGALKILQTDPNKENNFGFDNATNLRKEYTAQSKPFIEVRDAYSRIKVSAQDPSAAGDVAVIYNFMKMLDPGSVVREGEFATAQNAGGVDERIRAQYNKAMTGERLTPEIREDFVKRSDMIYEAQLSNQEGLETSYRDLAKRNKIDPENVVINYRTKVGAKAKKPTIDLSKASTEELLKMINAPGAAK